MREKAVQQVLTDHGIEWIQQDGDTFALDYSSFPVMPIWINISTVNVWHWLGY